MDYKIIVFVIGGMAVGYLIGYVKSWFKLRKYRKEIKELNSHLNRQMRITDAGNRSLEKELETLKKKNENLLISNKTLGQKPGREELRMLNIYEMALKKIKLSNPGFFTVWESAIGDAGAEFENSESGERPIRKRLPSTNQVSGDGGDEAPTNLEKNAIE